MLTISMLTALNRSNELKTHIRAALDNGVAREEVMEILLHANVYCGAPAAVEAFRCMREVFKDADAVADNRPHELELHVHAALNNGLTPDEIGEVLLQTAVYCGIAAAEDSFRIAQEAFKERAEG